MRHFPFGAQLPHNVANEPRNILIEQNTQPQPART
jgi:hypothetical protein